MDHYINKEVTYTKKELVRTTCDHCGAEIPEEKPYDKRDANFEYTTGSSFPEGGSEEGWNLGDLCDKCIVKLRGVLIENGFTTYPVSRDW